MGKNFCKSFIIIYVGNGEVIGKYVPPRTEHNIEARVLIPNVERKNIIQDSSRQNECSSSTTYYLDDRSYNNVTNKDKNTKKIEVNAYNDICVIEDVTAEQIETIIVGPGECYTKSDDNDGNDDDNDDDEVDDDSDDVDEDDDEDYYQRRTWQRGTWHTWPRGKLSDMERRHERGVEISSTDIKKQTGNSWYVTSQRNSKDSYLVQYITDCIDELCEQCEECNVCNHAYSCTCPDYEDGYTCKHIHSVAICAYRYTSDMERRHERGIEIYFTDIDRRTRNSWFVTSQANTEISYLVKYLTECFDNLCEKCDGCKVCKHTYSCTCPDYDNGYTCKHIHSVAIHKEEFDDIGKGDDDDDEEDDDEDYYQRCTWQRGTLSDMERRHERECIDELCEQCEECDVCNHAYSCTCPDYEDDYTCKHIHSVAIHKEEFDDIGKGSDDDGDDDDDDDDDNTDDTNTSY